MIPIPERYIKGIGRVLNDCNRPLKERYKALFLLRDIGGRTAIAYMKEAFNDPSALLKHEVAYCLGQMQDPDALPVLITVLEDTSQEAIVRHEAAEAIGALRVLEDVIIKKLLEKYQEDECVEVAQTCQLALQMMEWFETCASSDEVSPFNSVDPTPASSERDVPSLRAVLLDDQKTLFERYRAMFALRNIGSEESISALCEGLYTGGSLLRHEVAFVLGQVASPLSVPALAAALADPLQHEMVRHECAEALGAVASEECCEVLNQYLTDEQDVVRESCELALDTCEYENTLEFRFVNSLLRR